MARAELGHLTGELQVVSSVGRQQSRLDLLCAVAGDDDGVARLQGARCIDHVLHQSLTRESVQNLRHTALHTGAFAGSHDHHI